MVALLVNLWVVCSFSASRLSLLHSSRPALCIFVQLLCYHLCTLPGLEHSASLNICRGKMVLLFQVDNFSSDITFFFSQLQVDDLKIGLF